MCRSNGVPDRFRNMTPYLRSMETAVTFIEDHLQEEIKVADIAAAVSYSLFHFCRVFNQTVHHSPYDYLMRRRLSKAAIELAQGQQRITDIAYDYQFGSPESFSRAFRRMFKQLPTQWRKQGIRDPRMLMKRITPAHMAQRGQPSFRRPILVEKAAMTAVGLMTIAQDDAAVDQLKQQLPHSPTHIITHYPDYWAEQGRPLFAGRLDAAARPPLVSQTIAAHEYACFALPEAVEERMLLLDYVYQTWLPQSGYTLAEPLELEEDQKLLVPIVLDR